MLCCFVVALPAARFESSFNLNVDSIVTSLRGCWDNATLQEFVRSLFELLNKDTY